jgi:hypothetical protein
VRYGKEKTQLACRSMEEDVKQHNHPSPGDASSTSNRWIQAVILVEVDGPSELPRLQSPGLAHVWSVARMLL